MEQSHLKTRKYGNMLVLVQDVNIREPQYGMTLVQWMHRMVVVGSTSMASYGPGHLYRTP